MTTKIFESIGADMLSWVTSSFV